MKKYLVTGLAAVAISGMFTSCTHENDTAGGSSDLGVVETYEKAFISRFGTPSPDADWGFGPSTVKAGTRAAQSVVEPDNKNKQKPAQPAFSNEITMPTQYKNTLAEAKTIEGIELLKNNYRAGGTYYIDAEHWDNNNPYAVDIQNNALTLYFDGDIKFYGNNEQNNGTVFCVTENSKLTLLKVRNGLTVYLAPGATLDLTQHEQNWQNLPVATFQNTNSGIFLNTGSTVKAVNLEFVGGSKIRNNGTIETDYLSLNGQNQVNSSLWNEGEVKVKETLTLYNQDGEFINRNKLTAKNLDMKAGGRFLNVGSANITGTSYVTNSNSQWENEGEYTCGTFQVENAQRVYNNCNLTATTFTMNTRGQFVLQGGDKFGASVVCDNFTFGDDCDFWLGNKSLLSVKNALTVAHADRGYGFRGEGNTSYAVIQAGSIAKAANMNPDWSLSYYGKLYIDTPTHFAYENDQAHPRYVWDSDVKFSFQGDDSPVVIEKDENGKCNPGYKKTGDDPFEPVIRVIAEDMGDQSLKEASDFDFNDVVFDVTWVSESKVKIKILAAGGTLPLTVGWDGTGEDYITHEVHYMLGYSESTMINTHSTVGNHIDGVAPYEFEFTGTFSKANFAANVRDNIPVKVRKNGVWYDINAEQGRAPGKIAVGTDYNPWCNERVDIDDWWQNNNIQGLFYLYTQSPATLTKFWYKQATYRNGEPISK